MTQPQPLLAPPLRYDLTCTNCGSRNRPGQPSRDVKHFATLVAEFRIAVILCAGCVMIQVSDLLHAGCELTLLAYRPATAGS